MPQIILIAAIDRNNAIGYKNELLFYVPNDLKRFKELTTNHTVVMGRKTFESLPKGALPNRRNIVLSRKKGITYPNTEVFENIQEAIDSCEESELVYIIGGAEIYKQCMHLADKLELTEIDAVAPASDTNFPRVDKAIWKEEKRENLSCSEFNYAYITYIRR